MNASQFSATKINDNVTYTTGEGLTRTGNVIQKVTEEKQDSTVHYLVVDFGETLGKVTFTDDETKISSPRLLNVTYNG